jgi:exonuclease SbcD
MRIMHTADIHLGAEPDPGYPWSAERKEAVWDSWKRLIRRVREERADVLLVAGDLFHRQPLARELKEVNYLFSTIPETTVVLTAGNHDCIGRDSFYPGFPWNKNVIGLWDRKVRKVRVPGKSLCVYGCSYHAREAEENLYRGVRPEGGESFHILLAHGGDAKHSPMDLAELERAGFTYVALGHIHRPQILVRNRIAYAGALEPIDRNDTGPHGYMRVDGERGKTTAEFVPFASASYLDLELEVTEETTQAELEERACRAMEKAGKENIFRLILTGSREVHTEFSCRRLEQLGRISEVRDATRPALDMEELSRAYAGSLIGDFVDRYAGSRDPAEQKALYYGVEALLEARKEP